MLTDTWSSILGTIGDISDSGCSVSDNPNRNCCKMYQDQFQGVNDHTFDWCFLSSSSVCTSAEVPVVTMASRVKQPQGRLSALFSCCFKGSDQPEITYCHDNVSIVAALEPNLPMPPLQELDSMFTELVVSTRPESMILFWTLPSNTQNHSTAFISSSSFSLSFLPFLCPRMNWTLQRSTELTCLLCQQRKNGRSTVVRKW